MFCAVQAHFRLVYRQENEFMKSLMGGGGDEPDAASDGSGSGSGSDSDDGPAFLG